MFYLGKCLDEYDQREETLFQESRHQSESKFVRSICDISPLLPVPTSIDITDPEGNRDRY